MIDETTNEAGEPSPFGSGSAGRGRRAARFAVYGGAVLIALLVVFFMTRRDAPAPATGPDGMTAEEHAAMGMAPPAPDSAGPVMLSPAEAERIGVTYATVTAGPLTREVRTVGQVTFDETRVRTIAPKIDGWVEDLHVNATGQFVAQGAPLMSVYSPMLVSAQEELLLARRLARDVADGTPEAVRSAEELVSSARRRFAYWDIPASDVAAVERAGQVRRTMTLHSAVSGFVIDKSVLEGQRIMAGDALYRIADLGAVWLEGEVFEQDLAAATVGRPVTATFESFPGEEWSGRIAYIYPTLSAETRTARLRVALPNPGLRLKPGMYATFRFTGAGRAATLSVPRSAVLVTGERNLVFVRRPDGMLEPREVRVGVATADRVEMLAGVAEGETVVASATFLIDAESNLGSVLGDMANMPGMETIPPGSSTDRSRSVPVTPPADARAPAPPTRGPPPHAGHGR